MRRIDRKTQQDIKRSHPLLRGSRAATRVGVVLASLAPAAALGLTGGPSEPAASGPIAVSLDNLVDPFTGDFQYSVPLFELPGPQGGYPFSISYRSGIQTEQEASSVGLGWSFEPGRISRTLRGLPDDVAGEEVHQLFQQREAVGYGFTGTIGVEWLGLDNRLLQVGGDVGLQLFFDSYSGYGLGLALSQSVGVKLDDNLGANLGANADLNTHHGMTVGTTLGLNVGMGKLNPSYGASFNPATGLESAYWGYANIPLFSPAYVAAAQRSQWGDRVDFSIKVGAELWSVYPEGKVAGYYSKTRYSMPRTRTAYGYLHLTEAANRTSAQLDFIREKDGPLKPKTPYLPFTTLAHDTFELATSGGPGGSFRAYRNDIPILGDPSVTSSNVSVRESVEVGSGALVHSGVSGQLSTAESESSSWLPAALVSSVQAPAIPADPKEHVYFALTSDLSTETGIHADEPQYIALETSTSLKSPATLKGLGTESAVSWSEEPRPRATRIRSFTENQVLTTMGRWGGQFKNAHITRPTNGAGERIAGFEVTQPDGARYIFARPAYVNKEINCSFSVAPKSNDFHPGQTTIRVPDALGGALESWFNSIPPSAAGTASTTTLQLPSKTDQFLTCTSTPSYAHSYHLTSVLGVDYIDVTGDGPSDDDLGHWVRFEYTQVANYAYRSPYFGAHYSRGFERSYLIDDRGSFTYGEKELFVLSRATTASHQALFAFSAGALAKAQNCEHDETMEPRKDARGAWKLVQNGGPVSDAAGRQPKLVGAALCRRGDTVPVKVVSFEQDYRLAKGAPNGEANEGKLTLNKVLFQHGKDKSGERSPYEFHYDASQSGNPDYQATIEPQPAGNSELTPARWTADKNSDRWGYYQSCERIPTYPEDTGGGPRCSNGDEPYTRQSLQGSGVHPEAWSIRAVTTPSRARVEIDYEPDDYAFVQDQRAGVMVPARVVANTTCGQAVPTGATSAPEVCVDLNSLDFVDPPASHAEATALAEALVKNARGDVSQHIAFSTDLKLRSDLRDGGDPNMWDKVSGYLEVDGTPTVSGCGPTGPCEARVKLRPSRAGDKNYHPIAFAGWQHLRRNQPQFAVPGVSPPGVGQSTDAQLKSQARGLVQMIVRVTNVFSDYPASASAEQWASEVRDLRLRLFMPTGKKRGGGVRVKHLRMCEGPGACDSSDPALTIGKSYAYVELPDEVTGKVISSGVAAYEPSLGGDEISVRHPEFFDDEERIWAPNDPTYFERPLGESLFPAPVVGYRRVVERTLAGTLAETWKGQHPDLPPLSLAGERVHEFYTAKEFPVRAEASKVQKPPPEQELYPIPGIGSVLREKFAASQGFRVELNDMHGKPRRVTEFALKTDGKPAEGADRQTSYFYNVAGNRIDPSAPAVHQRSGTRMAATALGQRVEHYADLRQSTNSTNSAGMSFNADVVQIGPWPIPIPVPWPSYDDSEKESRTSVYHQIVHRNAALMAVETKDRSITTQSEHLAFDYQRGAPILTSTTNAFGTPIFDLNVPAYWLHDAMRESSNQLAHNAITLRSAQNPFLAGSGSCCQPSNITTLRVADVLDASATVFGRSDLVSHDLLTHNAPLLPEVQPFTAGASSSGWGTAWRPIATYRIDDSRRYAPSPAPNKDGRLASPVTFPISGLPEPSTWATTSNDPGELFAEPLSAFDELATSCSASRWKRDERFVAYHPRGPAVHSVTPLGRQDAVLYAHRAAVVQAVGQNAGYTDIGFESFESYTPGGNLTLQALDDGNIDFWTVFDVVPVTRVLERVPGRIHDGVVVWEKPFRQPFGGGDIDPVPPELLVRIDSHLGEPFVIEPRIDRMEQRGGDVVAVPSEPLPFSDREVTLELSRNVKVAGVLPAHLNESRGWLGSLWDWVTNKKVPKVQVTSAAAHTGARSLSVKGNAVYGQTRLAPKQPGTYVISAWVSRPDADVATFANPDVPGLADRLGIGVVVGGTVTVNAETKESEVTSEGISHFFEPVGPVIDGWQRIEGEFEFNTPGEAFTIYLQSGGGVFYIDDLRVFPKSASLQTFVYEPRALRLVARLDDNNMATRWQYDQDGQLRFAERETERGWRTIREHVNHLAELPKSPTVGGN